MGRLMKKQDTKFGKKKKRKLQNEPDQPNNVTLEVHSAVVGAKGFQWSAPVRDKLKEK